MILHQSRALLHNNDRCVPHPRSCDVLPDMDIDDNLKPLLRLAVEQGWRLEPTRTGKIKCWPADKAHAPITIPTRAVGRGLLNTTASLRGRGLVIPGKEDNVTKLEVIRLDADDPTPTLAPGDVHIDLRGDAMNSPTKRAENAVTLVKQAQELMNEFVSSQREITLTFSKGLITLMEPLVLMAGVGDDKLETQVLELMEQVDRLTKSNESLTNDLSRVGRELQAERQSRVAAEERAVKTENKLRMLKEALS